MPQTWRHILLSLHHLRVKEPIYLKKKTKSPTTEELSSSEKEKNSVYKNNMDNGCRGRKTNLSCRQGTDFFLTEFTIKWIDASIIKHTSKY